MAYKEVTDLSTDLTIALGGKDKNNKPNPTEIEGYYLGSRQVPDKKKKSGISYIHVFQTSQGNVGVWGKTDLDRKVLTVPLGAMTLVQYDKMVPTANGPMYKFKVAVDAENTVEVSASASQTNAQDDTDEAEETEDEDDSDADADAAQAQALAAAERKAKLEALLNPKGKSKSK